MHIFFYGGVLLRESFFVADMQGKCMHNFVGIACRHNSRPGGDSSGCIPVNSKSFVDPIFEGPRATTV